LLKFKERIIINSTPYEFDREDIINALKNTRPDRVRKFYFEIEGVEYPITQAIYSTVDIPKIYVRSNTANLLLRRLDFEIKQKY